MLVNNIHHQLDLTQATTLDSLASQIFYGYFIMEDERRSSTREDRVLSHTVIKNLVTPEAGNQKWKKRFRLTPSTTNLHYNKQLISAF